MSERQHLSGIQIVRTGSYRRSVMAIHASEPVSFEVSGALLVVHAPALRLPFVQLARSSNLISSSCLSPPAAFSDLLQASDLTGMQINDNRRHQGMTLKPAAHAGQRDLGTEADC